MRREGVNLVILDLFDASACILVLFSIATTHIKVADHDAALLHARGLAVVCNKPFTLLAWAAATLKPESLRSGSISVFCCTHRLDGGRGIVPAGDGKAQGGAAHSPRSACSSHAVLHGHRGCHPARPGL